MNPKSDSSLTLMVLVDALRPDYLDHAPFLRGLAAQSATGVFREGFGFVPRQAYFGGLSTAEYGFTNMYCYDPAESPFSVAWAIGGNRAVGVKEEPAGARLFVERKAKEKMSPFTQTYFSSYQIPLAYLPYFDLVEKHAPWDAKVGYRSLFAILDENDIGWCQQMWPDTNKLADRTDAGIARAALAQIQPHHRLACVHLQELDGTGHAHGPNSVALQKAMQRTDQLLREMVENLRQRFSTVKVVLFGDHGMVSVTRSLDLGAILEKTGLKFGADYVYFLDSSMARFWFYHHGARRKVEEALSGVSGGKILVGDELQLHGLDQCDRRNGELYFLADPGVLIFPNFFQQSGQPIPGMHGYDPDCPDNYGYFLWHDPSRADLAGQTLGKVDPHQLFPILLESVGLGATEHTQHEVPRPVAAATRRRYTMHPDPAAEQVVADDLAKIVQAIRDRVGEPEAVVLTGSFGRGEGGVYRDANGRYRPVNDYDVIVADHRDLRAKLAGLGDELAGQLGVDYVDLNPIDSRWQHLPFTIFTYDLKYGSCVIAGDEGVLDRIPAFASADIPVYEIVRLLFNRTAGLLTGLRGEWLTGKALTPDQQRYLTNQVAKALMALGDWHLLRWKGFDSSYARRRQRFLALAEGAGVDRQLIELIGRAYQFKCQPDYSLFKQGIADVKKIAPTLLAALHESIARFVRQPQDDLTAALSAYVRVFSGNAAQVTADNAAVRRHPALANVVTAANATNEPSLRHAVYAALPALLMAGLESDATMLELGRKILQPGFQLPPFNADFSANWEAHRDLVIKAWFAVCH